MEVSPHVRECGFRNTRKLSLWTPESSKFLLLNLESLVLEFEIRLKESANPTNDWNPESQFH